MRALAAALLLLPVAFIVGCGPEHLDGEDLNAEPSTLRESAEVADLVSGGAGIDQDDLPKGTTCVVVSVGFKECTTPDGKIYWCSYGVCEPKPRVTPRAPIVGPRPTTVER